MRLAARAVPTIARLPVATRLRVAAVVCCGPAYALPFPPYDYSKVFPWRKLSEIKRSIVYYYRGQVVSDIFACVTY